MKFEHLNQSASARGANRGKGCDLSPLCSGLVRICMLENSFSLHTFGVLVNVHKHCVCVYTVYVQIFAAHNFRGFRGFLKSAKMKLAKFCNTILKTLDPRKLFPRNVTYIR